MLLILLNFSVWPLVPLLLLSSVNKSWTPIIDLPQDILKTSISVLCFSQPLIPALVVFPKVLFLVLFFSSCIPLNLAFSSHPCLQTITSVLMILNSSPSLLLIYSLASPIFRMLCNRLHHGWLPIHLNSSKTKFSLLKSNNYWLISICSHDTAHSARNHGFLEHISFSNQISALSKSCYSLHPTKAYKKLCHFGPPGI